MDLWVNILEKLRNDKKVALLYVIDSQGSSPGRTGFGMAVTNEGELLGTIGGGIMEHKLVELARSWLKDRDFSPIIKRQMHQEGLGKHRSGMICSGEQTVAIYYLSAKSVSLVTQIAAAITSGITKTLVLSHLGLFLMKKAEKLKLYSVNILEENWEYHEVIGISPSIYIIGAGHVGLALSSTMSRLRFHVHIVDDRPNLNTLLFNRHAEKIIVPSYGEVGDYIPESDQVYVAIMTHGYRSDEICIQQLLHRSYAYIGVLGSRFKINKMLASLADQGYSTSLLNKMHTPIGLSIRSQTPEEIAVSIAAEIISVKNSVEHYR